MTSPLEVNISRGSLRASPRVFQFEGVARDPLGVKFMRNSLFAILILSSIAAAAFAQSAGLDTDIGNPGLGGKHTIQGRVFYPSGQPIDKRVRVNIRSVRGGPSSVVTDDNGLFTI